jgi:hypothetical protein
MDAEQLTKPQDASGALRSKSRLDERDGLLRARQHEPSLDVRGRIDIVEFCKTDIV